jgi:hypothetical protein
MQRLSSRNGLCKAHGVFGRTAFLSAFVLLLAACGRGNGEVGAGNVGSADAGSADGGSGGAGGGDAGGGDAGSGIGGSGDEQLEPGTAVDLQLSEQQAAELGAVESELLPDMTASDFAARYGTQHLASLGYDPLSAAALNLIQASPLALTAEETAKLAQNGFVISTRQQFPSFVYGYESIYRADLPVYVSADAILDAVHRSYDEILKAVELALLVDDARGMLTGMRAGLASITDETTRTDADFYLTVALSLLEGRALAPAAGAHAADTQRFFDAAMAATGTSEVTIFGVKRLIDFSQFEPRGHYTDDLTLQAYFRALMWLGRIDFRLIETLSDGSQVFRRRQVDAMIALRSLMQSDAFSRWSRMDAVIRAFVGESDYMTVPEVDRLLADLGGLAAVAAKSDAEIAQAIVDGGYGQQQIASQIIINETGATLPLSSSFALFGQRYVLDSHVLANVVWARTEAMRMMPSPLDAAFGALANNQAGALLDSELQMYAYAPNLHGMRVIADHHTATFWDANLYNIWLSSLRALSPAPDMSNPTAAGLPLVSGTEAWGRRLLNTQLASWAELRHDTILYAKQSYTDGASCEFPDAYVDPYPDLYAALGRFADYGSHIAELTQAAGQVELSERLQAYFGELASVVGTLREMAELQRTGAPFTAEHMAFINDAVATAESGCTTDGSVGWYARLFFDNLTSDDYDPTIADVHTQPTDEAGNMVGRVLHVGTGMPRLFVVTTNNCTGPRAYVGVVSSYFEKITEDFERLDDIAWSGLVRTGQSDVPWAAPLLAH